jgi:hypothetical protein
MPEIASVAMNALTRKRSTTRALTEPTTPATSTATPIATGIGKPCFRYRPTVRIAESEALAPADKSNWPHARHEIRPMLMISDGVFW